LKKEREGKEGLPLIDREKRLLCLGLQNTRKIMSLYIPTYASRILTGEGVRSPALLRSIPLFYYTRVAEEHENDPVGTRRLVRRGFQTYQGQTLCIEYVLTRVSRDVATSGQSHEVVVFLEGSASPYPWHQSHLPVPAEGQDPESVLAMDPELRIRHENQNILSRL
jgi:hypothetical protein